MSSEKGRPFAPVPAALCESFVEEAPFGVCVVQDGRIVCGNRWLREICGCPAGGASPPEALSIIHGDDRARVTRMLEQRLAGQDARPSGPVRLITRDGGVCEVEFHTRGIVYQGRAAIEGTLIQITERIAAARNLQSIAARLEESNRIRQRFGDILSHDLMNPVWIAENYLRLVMDGGVPDDKRLYYDGMSGSLARARSILADARTYLRIQDLVSCSGESVDFGQVVETVVKSLGPLAEQKGQTITVTRAGSAVVAASPLIKEVVSHLLSNAIKYSPPDAAIEVSLDSGARVRLAVRDRGPGVRAEDRERIFRRFESLEKGPISGVGLGLAIVRRVVELHRGRVWVEDNPGGGSAFIAEFPAAD